MIAVPQAFFDSPHIQVILRQGQNCVIRKEAFAVNKDNERYLAAHAITVVHAGQLVVKAPDADTRVVQPGEMILLPRGIYMISDIIPEPAPFVATVFFFDDELVEAFLEDFEERSALDASQRASHTIYDFPEVCGAFLDNLLHLRAAYKHRAATILKLQEFMHLVAGGPQGAAFLDALRALRNRKRQSVKSFMEQNFSLPLKIEDYAYLTGRSISTFHRDFKRQFGTGPKSWLVEKRLARAHARLKDKHGLSVTQLAYESGYDNVSYFIKAFQRQYGISPKQLQIQQREKATV